MERKLSWLEPAGFAVGLAGFLVVQVSIAGAVLAAAVLAAVIAAARGLVPKDPIAGVVAAAVVGLALPLRSAPDASLVAACLAVGGLALALGVAVPNAFDPIRTVAISGGAIAIGAGLLGTGFGALTGLPNARWLLAACGVASLGDPIAFLGVVAIGIAVIPSAIVRVVGSPNRIRIALAAGVPLLAAALATAQ